MGTHVGKVGLPGGKKKICSKAFESVPFSGHGYKRGGGERRGVDYGVEGAGKSEQERRWG